MDEQKIIALVRLTDGELDKLEQRFSLGRKLAMMAGRPDYVAKANTILSNIKAIRELKGVLMEQLN